MSGTYLQMVSIVVTTAATVVIALYAWKNHRVAVNSYGLSQELAQKESNRSQREQEFRQQMKDLCEAIVVATIVSDPTRSGQYVNTVSAFKALYKGQTPLFEHIKKN